MDWKFLERLNARLGSPGANWAALLFAGGLLLAPLSGAAETLSGATILSAGSQPVRAVLQTKSAGTLSRTISIAEFGGAPAPIRFYDRDMTKLLHLIAVDASLSSFMHVHPVLGVDGRFRMTLAFPHGGLWHLYADGIPHNFGRQVVRFDLQLPGVAPSPAPRLPKRSSKTGAYSIVLNTNSLQSGKMTMLMVHINRGGKPAPDLLPYLGARAHAVVVGTDLSYIHAHAMSAAMAMPAPGMMAMGMSAPKAPQAAPTEDPCNQDADLGMSLVELPPHARVAPDMMVMLQPATPGRYFLWLQFRGSDGVHTAPFVLVVR